MSDIAAPFKPARTRPAWWPYGIAATTLVLGVGLGFLAGQHKIGVITSVVLVLLAGAVFVYALGARMGVLALLIVTCLFDRFTISAGSIDVRSEQFAALMGLALVAYMAFAQPNGLRLIRPTRIEILLGLWFVVSLVSSVLFAPNVSHSVKGVGLLLISSMGLLLPRRLILSANAEEEIGVIVQILLVAVAAEAVYGFVTWVLHVFGPIIAMSPNGATGHYSSYGTLWEPNVFGAVCAAGAVAWTWLGPRYFRFASIGISLCLAGAVVSFTRAAWLAVMLVLALGFFGPLRLRKAQKQFVIGVIGAVVLTLVAVGAEHAGNYYAPLPPGTTTPTPHGILAILQNEVDVLGRLDQIKLGGPEIRSHLWLGNGTASYGVRHVNAGIPEHIANLELSVLYDTGIVGLALFLAFMLMVAWEAWKRRRDFFVAGFAMTALVLAITNTATETTELMVSWLLVGLLLMTTDIAASASASKSEVADRPA